MELKKMMEIEIEVECPCCGKYFSTIVEVEPDNLNWRD